VNAETHGFQRVQGDSQSRCARQPDENPLKYDSPASCAKIVESASCRKMLMTISHAAA